MNNSSLKKRLLSVAMAAVMVFSLLPATAWAAMAENLPAASGQIRTEQKRGGSDTYTVTRDVKSVAAAQTGAVKKVTCLDLTTGEDQVSLDADGGYRWVAGANYLYLYKVQIEAEGSNALSCRPAPPWMWWASAASQAAAPTSAPCGLRAM